MQHSRIRRGAAPGCRSAACSPATRGFSAKVGAVGAMTRTWPDGETSRSGDPRSGDDAAIDEGGLGGASASADFHGSLDLVPLRLHGPQFRDRSLIQAVALAQGRSRSNGLRLKIDSFI